MKEKPSFIYGVVAGVLLTLSVLFFLNASGVTSNKSFDRQIVGDMPAKPVKVKATSEPGSSPTIGPKNAPVTLIEYADFHCGYCKKAHKTTQKLLADYAGKIHYVFKHYPLSNTPGAGSFLTHEAAACAQEQGKFWSYHDRIFEETSRLNETRLKEIATDIGLNRSTFDECLSSGRYRAPIQTDKEEGSAKGVSGTPAFFLNDERIAGAYPYDYFSKKIEGILDPSKREKIAEAPVKKEPPKVVKFTDLDRGPSKGPKDAKVTIVEFSDFHCPFCGRVLPTLTQLMEKYPKDVRVIWRHYPLPFHVGAEKTHAASECAHDQNKFWEYHDKLFENIGKFKTDEALIGAAGDLGLDTAKFKSCLESGKHDALVQKDIEFGNQNGVRGTPAFFINGRLISGAKPFSSFDNAVQSILDPSKADLFPDQPNRRPSAPPKKVDFDDLDGRPSQGPANAKITLVEFSDFHCPFCKRVSPTIQQLMDNYAGKVKRVWRHYPLPFHVGAELTHAASECAHDQGKFWEYKKQIFETFTSSQRTQENLISLATNAGLDEAAFKSCLESGRHDQRVKDDFAAGNKAGVRGTPAFFVNGTLVSGAQPYASFEKAFEKELKA